MPRTIMSRYNAQTSPSGEPPTQNPEDTTNSSASKSSKKSAAERAKEWIDDYIKQLQERFPDVPLPGRKSDIHTVTSEENPGQKDPVFRITGGFGSTGEIKVSVSPDGEVTLVNSTFEKNVDEYRKAQANPTKTTSDTSAQVDEDGYYFTMKDGKAVYATDEKGNRIKGPKKEAAPQTADEAANTRARTRLAEAQTASAAADTATSAMTAENKLTEIMGADPEGNPTLAAQKQDWDQNVKFPYDVLKARYDSERELWTQKIAAGTASVAQAKEQLAAWKLQNFDIPHQQYQDQLTRAQEVRLRQSVEDERAKAEADIALRRATLQQSARQLASDNMRSLLPYSVGDSFASEFAAGLGALGRSDSTGVSFSPDAFTFKAPDFDAVQERAAKNSTKGVKEYKRNVLDKEGWSTPLPAAPTYSSGGIPQIPNIDFNSMATGSQQSLSDFDKYVRSLGPVADILAKAEQQAASDIGAHHGAS